MRAKTFSLAVETVSTVVLVSLLLFLVARPLPRQPTDPVLRSRPRNDSSVLVGLNTDKKETFARVKVHYATDRAPVTLKDISWVENAHRFYRSDWGLGAAVLLLIILVGLMRWAYKVYKEQATRLRAYLGPAISFFFLLVLAVLLPTFDFLLQRSRIDKPGSYYGSNPGELDRGVCEVTIPHDHRIGGAEDERPSFITLFREDPNKHVILAGVRPLQPEAFQDSLKSAVGQTRSKEAFVYIHGFNTTFEFAARRAGALAYDLNLDIVPIVYSWPSKGEDGGYPADVDIVGTTVEHLLAFLDEVVSTLGVQKVHVIAHSMGNRALIEVLRRFAMERKEHRILFKQILLAAPDVNLLTFQQAAPHVLALGQGTTLYFSADDKAIALSEWLNEYGRIGGALGGIFGGKGLWAIDASSLDTSGSSHAYVFHHRIVLEDVARLLKTGEEPPRFALKKTEQKEGTWWVFRQ